MGLRHRRGRRGNAYVTGYTSSESNTFPVTGGPDLTYNGGYDAFVAKVNPAAAPGPTPAATPTPTVTPTTADDATPIPGPGWQPMGSGMNGAVRALAAGPDGRSIYAGGDFTTAGGVTANYVARWDGTAWQALGGGIERPSSARSGGGAGRHASTRGATSPRRAAVRRKLHRPLGRYECLVASRWGAGMSDRVFPALTVGPQRRADRGGPASPLPAASATNSI